MASTVIYTRDGCGYCLRALRLLAERGAAVEERNASANPAYRAEMMRRSGRQTFPQIFIGATHVGGIGSGGFRLSRPPATITLADVIEAVEGPIALTTCVDTGQHDCALDGSCRVKPHWNAVNGAVRSTLANVTLATLSAACLALSLSAPPIGVFLVLRRMSLMSDAMAHAILPGAALGYLVAGFSLPAMSSVE